MPCFNGASNGVRLSYKPTSARAPTGCRNNINTAANARSDPITSANRLGGIDSPRRPARA